VSGKTPEQIVQAQFDAYNVQDVDGLCASYAPGCIVASYNGAVIGEGLDALRSRHVALFAQHPKNRAILLHRIVLGDKVIDHEDVERAPGGERFGVVVIYTVKDGLIVRSDFVKAG
jgi:hypothetical protein